MSDFRVLFFGATGRVTKAIAIECADEDDAIERVGGLEHPYPVELWRGLKRIRSFNAWGEQAPEPPQPLDG